MHTLFAAHTLFLGFQLHPASFFAKGRYKDDRRGVADVAVERLLRRVAEEGRQLIDLFLQDRVELMIVAGGASDGESKEHGAGGVDAIFGVNRLEFLGNDATFVRGGVAAMEAGGDPLVKRSIGQQIAGDLLNGELIEFLVLIEGADDPIAIGPDLAEVVDVDAVCVGVACGIKPIARAMLAPLRRVHELVDQFFIGIRRGIFNERVDDLWLRWKSCEIERHAASQRAAVGFGRGAKA